MKATRDSRGPAYISAPSIDRNMEEAVAESRTSNLVSRLVNDSRRGDREAFGELYRLHYGQIFRMARFYLGEAAEDAVAETFLRAWLALPRYRDTGAPFVAWVYGIARHVVTDELRRRRRVEPREEMPDRPTEFPQDDRLALAGAVRSLPKEQRQVIELKYLVGLTNPEVAGALGRSVGAINALQWRALRTMKGMLGE